MKAPEGLFNQYKNNNNNNMTSMYRNNKILIRFAIEKLAIKREIHTIYEAISRQGGLVGKYQK